MTHVHMLNNEVIYVEESLERICKIINHMPQQMCYGPRYIHLTRATDLNRNLVIVNVNNILYMYDDGIDLL